MIKKIAWTIGIAATLAAMTSVAATAKERTPDGSFLRYRANTVAELRDQISTDPVARARYSAHYGVPASNLLSTIGEGLQLVSLKAPMKVEIWYVRRNAMTHKTKLLPKGSQVFATQDGRPILAWSCGNPLRASKELVSAARPPADKNITEKVLPSIESISTLAVTAPPGLIAETMPALAVAEPALTVPTLGAAAVPTIAGLAPAAVSTGGKLYNLGWLAGLAAVASRRDSTPPVPEPTSILALAAGLSSMVALGRNRRRK